jgi:hypothetical protein
MPRALLAVVLAVLGTLAACGSDDPETGPVVSLTISVRDDQDDDTTHSATLGCPGKTPRDRDACAALEVVAPQVFEPVPVDQACTMIFGGPETATVTGTFAEDTVDASFSRSNGCEITRWDQIEPVLSLLKLA